jgi:hypothetical protein
MGMDPLMTDAQLSLITELLYRRKVSARRASKMIDDLLHEWDPSTEEDPRDQWKHHIRNNTPHE